MVRTQTIVPSLCPGISSYLESLVVQDMCVTVEKAEAQESQGLPDKSLAFVALPLGQVNQLHLLCGCLSHTPILQPAAQ